MIIASKKWIKEKFQFKKYMYVIIVRHNESHLISQMILEVQDISLGTIHLVYTHQGRREVKHFACVDILLLS